jgi:adenylate cyclase, class 2
MEVKIVEIDIDDIRKKLADVNAVKVKEENQVNNIFDFPDRRLLNAKGYARIRIVEDKLTDTCHYYMTVKKMLSQEKYKIMDEQEVEILDGETGDKIFESLGLELTRSIKKSRESYKYKNTLVEIDINDKSFCPFPYLEIETSSEDELKEVVQLLGYDMKDTTSKTIYEILADKGVVINN